MTHILRLRALSLAGAMVLAFALASTASAAVSSAAPDALGPGEPTLTVEADALARVLDIGILPPQARAVFNAILTEDGNRGHAGFICRRIAAAGDDAPAELVERCRLWLAGQDEAPGGLAGCRRIAAAGADAPAELVERCRAALEGSGDRPHPVSACRRVANLGADAPEELVERCREWLAGQDDVPRPGLEVCRRIAAAEGVDAELVERCRAALDAAAEDGRRGPRADRGGAHRGAALGALARVR